MTGITRSDSNVSLAVEFAGLFVAEEFLRVLKKADEHHDARSEHSKEEHGVQNVHSCNRKVHESIVSADYRFVQSQRMQRETRKGVTPAECPEFDQEETMREGGTGGSWI